MYGLGCVSLSFTPPLVVESALILAAVVAAFECTSTYTIQYTFVCVGLDDIRRYCVNFYLNFAEILSISFKINGVSFI